MGLSRLTIRAMVTEENSLLSQHESRERWERARRGCRRILLCEVLYGRTVAQSLAMRPMGSLVPTTPPKASRLVSH